VPITIGSNIGSLKAQRRLADAASSLASTYERLSSGQRINKASDDAAGLAISMDLGARSRVYSQAMRNANAGVSLLNIADAAVNSLVDINTRLQELAEQSANGVYSSSQRNSLDAEAQALAKEYFRISRSAQFNGTRLFDGSMSDGLRLQLGYGISGSIQTGVGGKLGTGSLTTTLTLSNKQPPTNSVTLGDLNGDGILDMVTGDNAGEVQIRLGKGDGTFGAASAMQNTESVASVLAKDLNGDGVLDLITLGQSLYSGGPSMNAEVSIRLGNGDGTFGSNTKYIIGTDASGFSFSSSSLAIGDVNGDGILDVVTGGSSSSSGFAAVQLGTGDGRLSAASTYSFSGGALSIALGDINGDGRLDLVAGGSSGVETRLGTGSGTFGNKNSTTVTTGLQSAALGDVNGDGILDLISAQAGVGSNANILVNLGNGQGGFGATATFQTNTSQQYLTSLGLADLNGDGALDIVAGGTDNSGFASISILVGNGTGNFSLTSSNNIFNATHPGDVGTLQIAFGDLNGDGVTDVAASGYSYDTQTGTTGILIGQTRDGISPIQPFSLKSRGDALQALGLFSRTAKNLADIRGNLGSAQSRINTALGVIGTSRENYLAANSRILDADIAGETGTLTRTQILQQAGAAVLAQANQAPALALRLLT